MSLSSPFLPPNPLYPRPSGGAGAEGLKKQFLINNDMIFRITFGEPDDVTNPGQDGFQYSFPFSIVDLIFINAPEVQSKTTTHRVIVPISRSCFAEWKISVSDLPKILFEYGKRHIQSLIEKREFPSEDTIRASMISTASHPDGKCPFDPATIPLPNGHSIDVVQPNPKMGF